MVIVYMVQSRPRCDNYTEVKRLGLCVGPGGGPREERGQAAPGLAEAGQGIHIS